MTSEAEERSLSMARSSRGRGRHKAKAVQRGRRKDDPDSEVDETSIHTSSSSGDEHKHELQAEILCTDSVRRSKRARKDVNYADEDEESDKQTDLPNRTSQKCSNDEAAGQDLSGCHNVSRNNVAKSSRETELTSKDPSFGDGLAGDYLATGGRFCADEDELEMENHQEGLIQTGESTPGADKDYLQMGGGFCIDEDGEDREENHASGDTSDQSDLPIPPAESAPDEIQASSQAEELNLSDPNDAGQSNISRSTQDNVPSSVSAFSGIPFLKRKRRKN